VRDNGSVRVTTDRAQFSPARLATLILIALIYIVAIVLVLANIEPKALQAARSVPVVLILALLALSALNYVFRAWRWQLISDKLELRAPLLRNILYYLSGFSLASTPGKAGEVIRLWFLKRGHQIEYVRSLPLMVADRLFDAYAVLLLTLVATAGFSDYRWQLALVAGVVAAASAPLFAPAKIHDLLRRLASGRPRLEKGLELIAPAVQSMEMLANWRTYGMSLALGLLGWLAECAALFVLLKHFSADVSFANAIFVFSFSMLVGAVSFLPGGLGSTEAAMVVLLRILGVDLSIALAATAIVRITTFWFAVAIGLIAAPAAIRMTSRSAAGNAGNLAP